MSEEVWVNACSMVYEPDVFSWMNMKQNSFERGLLANLANQKELVTYKHDGFWSPMETRRDRSSLEYMWKNGEAPWKVWKED